VPREMELYFCEMREPENFIAEILRCNA